MSNNNFTVNQSFTGPNNVEYLIKLPLAREYKLAQMEYNKTYGEAIKAGAVLRAKLNEYMADQKIWSEQRIKRVSEIAMSITDGEKKLSKGGIKLSEAQKIAKQIKKDRNEFQELATERAISDSNTAEGQAENARFQRLLTTCLVYKDNDTPVYNSLDELLNETDETMLKVSNEAFEIFGKMIYKLDDTFESKLPENVFLKKFKMVDDKGRLINKDGHLIDDQNRLINENGRLINDKGEFVDGDGNLITEEGDLISKIDPIFYDEEGNPIELPAE